jgi:hypothetical protein
MGLFDSILGAVTGKTDSSGGANPLMGILGGLLAQSGGLQGLASKFSQAGQGGAFSSWVGMGENQSISADQIQKVLGSDQVNALAAKPGQQLAGASPVRRRGCFHGFVGKAQRQDKYLFSDDAVAAILPAETLLSPIRVVKQHWARTASRKADEDRDTETHEWRKQR